ncbi:hypothetical protein P8452_38741 [Trifolium repens]|jgi:hypothetical protein|nr:hypothetical protein QL285_071095 [Trifolium repens]WJX52651.1 hypothetical protein P8452_38741 [Trifolium repens]
MASLVNESNDSEIKKGWMENSLSSISTPPLQLVAIVGIVVFLLWISSYMNMQSTSTNLNLFLLFLTLVITLISLFGRYVAPESNVTNMDGGDGGQSTWGSVALLMFLLVFISNRLHPLFVVAIVFLYMYVLSV